MLLLAAGSRRRRLSYKLLCLTAGAELQELLLEGPAVRLAEFPEDDVIAICTPHRRMEGPSSSTATLRESPFQSWRSDGEEWKAAVHHARLFVAVEDRKLME